MCTGQGFTKSMTWPWGQLSRRQVQIPLGHALALSSCFLHWPWARFSKLHTSSQQDKLQWFQHHCQRPQQWEVHFGLGNSEALQAQKPAKAKLFHSLPAEALEQFVIATCRLGNKDPFLLSLASIQNSVSIELSHGGFCITAASIETQLRGAQISPCKSSPRCDGGDTISTAERDLQHN